MTKKFSLTPYLFLTPALLVIAVFVLYPIVAVVYYSFTDYNIVTPPVWIGLRNYQQLLQDPIFWQALSHSFIYLLVTPILIFLSIILAIVVNRKLPGINAFRAHVLYSRHQRQHRRRHCLALDVGYQRAAQRSAASRWAFSKSPSNGWLSRPTLCRSPCC